MLLNRLFTFILCLSLFTGLQAQKRKDGAKTISTANSKVNEFTALTSSVAANATLLNVTANGLNTNARFTSTLTPGDLVMIIQMQGALIKLSPVPIWAPDSTYGSIYDYQLCGNYEFAEVKSTISTNQIELTCGLTYSYSSTGKTQIVRVPRFSSLNVTGTGTLTTDAWNGTIGGVLAVEVDGNTTIDGMVNTTGLGFRGGVATSSGGNNFYPFSTLTSTSNGSEKGEGIGSDRITNLTHDTLGKYCKGAPGNGGGGGNANNCGGGGGGNGGNIAGYNGYGVPTAGFNAIWDLEWPGRSSVTSSGGGKGGYGTSTTTTANINSVGPNDTRWGSFKRLSAGGYGGRPLDYSTGKIFMGGGGGAGHLTGSQSNGTNAGNGGAGGGLIYFLNYGSISGNGTISSNGANGNNAFGSANFSNPIQGIDGPGGAGAGGTIILQSNGSVSGITTNANGGNGGNQIISGATSSEGQGPGGGGSGGYIASTNISFTQNVNGGVNGTTNATAFDTEFPMNGATSGDIGTKSQMISPSYSLTASPNQTICTNQSATLTASATNTAASIQWYNALNTAAVSNGTVYVTPAFTSTGTYTLYAGSCPGIYRLPIIITVTNGPTFSINSPTICSGQSTVLTVTTSATSYTWNTSGSPTTSTLSVSPSSTTIYTINGSSSSCVGTHTAQVTVNTVPTISVANATVCAGNTATLTATGATSYTWDPGNINGSTFTVNPVANTVYNISGSIGSCSSATTATVFVNNTPTLTANSATICSGQAATFTVSGASTYTWNPGTFIGTTYTISPTSSTTVSVIGANGTCTAQITRSVTVSPNPTVTVTNQTICPTQNITLTANGATTYSWNTGQNTNTISVSPSSLTIYSVTGTTESCSDTKTVSVFVADSPTISVGNATICSGNSTILAASGASNYTWSPGGQLTSSISVSPSSTQNYTITGSNGTCTNSTVATVSVTSTPTLTANSLTICPGQTATLTAGGATSYTWNPGSTTGTTYTISPASDATVSLTGANGNCFFSTTLSVTIGTGISISVNNPTICSGQTASLTASGATSYTWDTGANTNTLNVNPTSTQIYTVSGTSGSCSGINTVTVTVVNQPSVSVANASICSGNSATLTASGANTYLWMPGGETTATISVNPTATETYTITGSNGTCTNSTIATVSITNTPTLAVNSVTTCAGQNATLTVSGATSYTWDSGSVTGDTFTTSPVTNTFVTVIGANGSCTASATPSITIGNGISISVNSPTICSGETASLTAGGATSYTWDTGANTSTLNVSPISTTVYTVTGSNGSCNGINTATVTVNSVPIVTVNSPIICAGETASLTAAGGATSYTWNTGPNTNTLNVSPTTTTNYTVSGSDGTCEGSATSTVTVNSTPTVTVNPVGICAGQTATLIAIGATSYTWNTTETNDTINTTPANTSTYTVTGANGNCNSDPFTVTVTVSPSPTLNVNASNTTGCAPVCVNFTDATSSSCTAILYNFGDGSIGLTNNPTHCYVTGGNYTVTATCTNTFGCASTFTVPGVIQVDTSPDADFSYGEGNVFTVGSTVNLTNSSSNATSYIWSLCGSVSTLTNVTISYADTGNCCIELVTLNTQGCSDTVSKCIQIVDEAVVVIPNVFTPNGDTRNDFFSIKTIGVKDLNCVIFDRWGLKMHEWDGINGYWDGAAKSGAAPDGTYFYIINYTDQLDQITTEKGFLNLFRD